MKNLNNTLHVSNYAISYSLLERSQIQILALGYHVVMFKSKLKKRLKILVRVLLFNF